MKLCLDINPKLVIYSINGKPFDNLMVKYKEVSMYQKKYDLHIKDPNFMSVATWGKTK